MSVIRINYILIVYNHILLVYVKYTVCQVLLTPQIFLSGSNKHVWKTLPVNKTRNPFELLPVAVEKGIRSGKENEVLY